MAQKFFDDLAVGDVFRSGSYAVTAEEIVAFGRQYDPQPAHTDEASARASAFGRLVASGWHTAAITMRLLVDSAFFPQRGSMGAGVDALRWVRPVVPGDVLHLVIEVAELRPSRSKPDRGLVTLAIETRDAAGEVVQTQRLVSLIPRRAAANAT
jgi:acyl dehydratase